MGNFLLGTLFPGSIFILKYELKKIPIFSQYFKKLGFIFVKREKAFDSLKILLKSVKKLISKMIAIFVIFPEGTRIMPGERIKLNSGVFAIHKFTIYQFFQSNLILVSIGLIKSLIKGKVKLL